MPGIFASINTISRCQTLFRNKELGAELNGSYHMFVYSVMRSPGSSQEELAKRLCLNKSTVARALASLEAEGFVERVPDSEDKRKLLVYPTEKMEAIYPEVRRVSLDWREKLLSDLSAEETELAKSILEKMESAARRTVSEEVEQ